MANDFNTGVSITSGRMSVLRHFLLAAVIFGGCATACSKPPEEQAPLLYYDRNGDGKVDLEKHHYPELADADWELRDDNYDGIYEKKIRYGLAVTSSVVNIPVPTGVKIEKTP